MKLMLVVIALLLCNTNNINSQQSFSVINSNTIIDTSLSFSKKNIFTTESSYTGEFANNFRGGIKKGSVYLGIANIKLSFKTEDMSLWSGGQFSIHGASTHGKTPSSELFGDFQVASNIEAGNHTYMHELWYKHSFNSFEITVGLQDLNVEFLTNEYSSQFINSSFGIPSLISDNVPAPIFPLTALGISLKYSVNELLVLQTALFDGLPEDFSSNEHNINWRLHENDGLLSITEAQYSTTINSLPGTYKAGVYYHSHLQSVNQNAAGDESVFEKNYGFYLLGNQTVMERGNSTLGLFAQIALSPSKINLHNYYIGGGISCSGVFNNDGNDLFGAAFAHAGFNSSTIKNETTIEVFYKTHLTQNLFIQPDVQYIINPAGSSNNLDNALGALIRFGIIF